MISFKRARRPKPDNTYDRPKKLELKTRSLPNDLNVIESILKPLLETTDPVLDGMLHQFIRPNLANNLVAYPEAERTNVLFKLLLTFYNVFRQVLKFCGDSEFSGDSEQDLHWAQSKIIGLIASMVDEWQMSPRIREKVLYALQNNLAVELDISEYHSDTQHMLIKIHLDLFLQACYIRLNDDRLMAAINGVLINHQRNLYHDLEVSQVDRMLAELYRTTSDTIKGIKLDEENSDQLSILLEDQHVMSFVPDYCHKLLAPMANVQLMPSALIAHEYRALRLKRSPRPNAQMSALPEVISDRVLINEVFQQSRVSESFLVNSIIHQIKSGRGLNRAQKEKMSQKFQANANVNSQGLLANLLELKTQTRFYQRTARRNIKHYLTMILEHQFALSSIVKGPNHYNDLSKTLSLLCDDDALFHRCVNYLVANFNELSWDSRLLLTDSLLRYQEIHKVELPFVKELLNHMMTLETEQSLERALHTGGGDNAPSLEKLIDRYNAWVKRRRFQNLWGILKPKTGLMIEVCNLNQGPLARVAKSVTDHIARLQASETNALITEELTANDAARGKVTRLLTRVEHLASQRPDWRLEDRGDIAAKMRYFKRHLTELATSDIHRKQIADMLDRFYRLGTDHDRFTFINSTPAAASVYGRIYKRLTIYFGATLRARYVVSSMAGSDDADTTSFNVSGINVNRDGLRAIDTLDDAIRSIGSKPQDRQQSDLTFDRLNQFLKQLVLQLVFACKNSIDMIAPNEVLALADDLAFLVKQALSKDVGQQHICPDQNSLIQVYLGILLRDENLKRYSYHLADPSRQLETIRLDDIIRNALKGSVLTEPAQDLEQSSPSNSPSHKRLSNEFGEFERELSMLKASLASLLLKLDDLSSKLGDTDSKVGLHKDLIEGMNAEARALQGRINTLEAAQQDEHSRLDDLDDWRSGANLREQMLARVSAMDTKDLRSLSEHEIFGSGSKASLVSQSSEVLFFQAHNDPNIQKRKANKADETLPKPNNLDESAPSIPQHIHALREFFKVQRNSAANIKLFIERIQTNLNRIESEEDKKSFKNIMEAYKPLTIDIFGNIGVKQDSDVTEVTFATLVKKIHDIITSKTLRYTPLFEILFQDKVIYKLVEDRLLENLNEATAVMFLKEIFTIATSEVLDHNHHVAPLVSEFLNDVGIVSLQDIDDANLATLVTKVRSIVESKPLHYAAIFEVVFKAKKIFNDEGISRLVNYRTLEGLTETTAAMFFEKVHEIASSKDAAHASLARDFLDSVGIGSLKEINEARPSELFEKINAILSSKSAYIAKADAALELMFKTEIKELCEEKYRSIIYKGTKEFYDKISQALAAPFQYVTRVLLPLDDTFKKFRNYCSTNPTEAQLDTIALLDDTCAKLDLMARGIESAQRHLDNLIKGGVTIDSDMHEAQKASSKATFARAASMRSPGRPAACKQDDSNQLNKPPLKHSATAPSLSMNK